MMRSHSGVPALLFAGWLLLGTAPATKASPDSLTSYGHSFVKITTGGGTVIFIDPFAADAFDDSADAVLITHEHTDHNELARVRQKAGCQVIRAATALVGGVYQTFAVRDLTISAVPAYNGYHAKSSCVGYVLTFDGIRLYHAGDTGKIAEMAALDSLQITYALLPMDGIYTMTPEDATSAAAMINALHDIPIHTMPPPDTYSDAIVARFSSPHLLVVRPGSSVALNAASTFVAPSVSFPRSFRLAQNYPNPFNPTTVIAYELAAAGSVSLKIYDILGRQVAVLAEGYQSPGMHTVKFDGAELPSGLYVARLSAGRINAQMKMVLLK